MDAGRWREVRQLFDAALEAEDATREVLLERLSGRDAALRAEVLSLVEAHRDAAEFLEGPAFRLLEGEGRRDPDAPERIGPYRVLSELGHGGMGTVFLAERGDDVFDKRVAIKVLRRGLEPDARERFALERQALAELDHPNVARILDGGSLADGRPYLVMELVDGLRIDLYCERAALPLDRRLRLVVEVCEAVVAAHRQGIVHGDLKPSNVLVTAAGTPRLIDFGISSRFGEATSASRLTLAYASPEQARGEPLAPASDVYSLGVMLFELLTGHRPFALDEVELDEARRILSEETPPRPSDRVPQPLRRQLRGDLDALLLKALAPAPRERYGSVRELGEDLVRFLAHQPLSSRPHAVAYVAGKAARRNPLAATLLALAPLGLAGAGLLLGRSRREAWRRGLAAHHFTRRGRELLELRRRSALLPRGRSAEHREQAEGEIDALREEMTRFGRPGVGPGRFALACAFSTLDRYERARSCLEGALKAGFESPEVSLLLAKTLWSLYLEELPKAERLPGEADRRSRLEELRAQYRDPALRHLRIAERAGGDELLYVRSLIAYYDGDLDRALELTTAAFRHSPWLYEAKQLEAEIAIARAKEAASRGRIPLAEELFRCAGEGYREALAIGRSDARLWAGEAARRAELFELCGPTLGMPPIALEEVLEACAAAHELNPSLTGPKLAEARVLWRWGDLLERRALDPMRAVTGAIAAAEEALRADPAEPAAFQLVGLAASVAIRWHTGTRQHPGRWLLRGYRALRRALRLQPRRASYHNALGNLLMAWVDHVVRSGGDPDPALTRAAASYARAVALDPASGKFHSNLGTAYGLQASFDLDRGRDPGLAGARAARSLERALAINPADQVARTNLVFGRCVRAAHRVFSRADAAVARAALDALDQALDEAPAAPSALSHPSVVNRSESLRLRAWLVLREGDDPSEQVAAGLRLLEEERVRSPNQYLLPLNQALLLLLDARCAIRAGRSPEPAVRAALAALDEAGAMQDADAWTELTRAQACWLQARWERDRDGDPRPWVEAGRAALPELPETHCLHAQALAVGAALLGLEAEVAGRADLARRSADLLRRSAEGHPIAHEQMLGPSDVQPAGR